MMLVTANFEPMYDELAAQRFYFEALHNQPVSNSSYNIATIK
jgi:hypothetical protein